MIEFDRWKGPGMSAVISLTGRKPVAQASLSPSTA